MVCAPRRATRPTVSTPVGTGGSPPLNSLRWFDGADGFASIQQYRRYQINHEFGHGLGHAHEYCAEPGQLAPVMMQQSKGLLGC